MFYAISGINGDYEAYKRALKKLKFQNLDDIKEEDIMNEEAVISTLEGEDVLYVDCQRRRYQRYHHNRSRFHHILCGPGWESL